MLPDARDADGLELMRRPWGPPRDTEPVAQRRAMHLAERRRLEIVATVTTPSAVKAILECLGLPARPPPVAPAREREQGAFEFDGGDATWGRTKFGAGRVRWRCVLGPA